MRLAFPSIGPLGNKPHFEIIDSDINFTPTAIKVPLGLPFFLVFTPLISNSLYYYTASTAAASDAVLLSSPPDKKKGCLFDGNDTMPTYTDHVAALLSCSYYPAVLRERWRVFTNRFNPNRVEPDQAFTNVCNLTYLGMY